MAQIPRQLLDDLSDELNALSAEGQRMIKNVLDNAEWETVEELRIILAEAMEQICGTMADYAAARTADFYDNVRELSVGKKLGAEPISGREPKATEGAVRAFVQSVVETGATAQLANHLTERIDYEIKRASGECIYRNAERDPLKPRYARVPSGIDTCDFCIMLASRGFVYRSKITAGEARDHYHSNCRCRIVPGFEGLEVDGYNTDALYEQWKQSVEGKQLSDGVLKARIKPATLSGHSVRDSMSARGVLPSQIEDALDNPIHVGVVKFDEENRPSVVVVGNTATVAYNPLTDTVATTWPTSERRRKKYSRKEDADV